MDGEIIKHLFEKKEYYEYLKENSEWIKILKRNKYRYKDFLNFVKKKYKLRTQDKINNALNKASMLSEVLSSIK